MASKCNVRVPEELVLSLLTKPAIRDKYQQFTFLDYVKSHPQLRFCPGPNCQVSRIFVIAMKTNSFIRGPQIKVSVC